MSNTAKMPKVSKKRKKQTAEATDFRITPTARGRRLRILRMLADFSRKDMAEKYKISTSTLQAWEEGKGGGLSDKGALRVIEAFRHAGVNCSYDWLLHDIGTGPQLVSQSRPLLTMEAYQEAEEANQEAISQELLVFRRCNTDSIDMLVLDDGMAPIYNKGDYIGGRRRFEPSAISSLIGCDCMVETTFGEKIFRRLRPGAEEGFFNLVCVNPNADVAEPTRYNVKLVSAAPVIWHRRVETIKVAAIEPIAATTKTPVEAEIATTEQSVAEKRITQKTEEVA